MNQEQLRPLYEWPYDWPRRIDLRQGIPNFHPGFVGMPASLTVTEALDPAVLAGRMKLFEVEHKKVFDVALKEVQDGYKNRHWIWSVFPQAAGLPEHFRKDSSETSRKFSILCFDEAVAFLEHPILGPNYLAIVEAVRNQLGHRGLEKIFGRDYKKAISSVTLFRRAARFSRIVPAQADSADDEEQRTATRTLTEAERRDSNEFVANAIKQLKEQQRPKNIHELPSPTGHAKNSERLEDPFGTGYDFTAVASREFVSPLGGVLIDHCDAILARAGEEDLKHCSYSQEFDSRLDRQFAWRLDGGSGVSSFSAHDDEYDFALDPRPWRGDAWSSWIFGPTRFFRRFPQDSNPEPAD